MQCKNTLELRVTHASLSGQFHHIKNSVVFLIYVLSWAILLHFLVKSGSACSLALTSLQVITPLTVQEENMLTINCHQAIYIPCSIRRSLPPTESCIRQVVLKCHVPRNNALGQTLHHHCQPCVWLRQRQCMFTYQHPTFLIAFAKQASAKQQHCLSMPQ